MYVVIMKYPEPPNVSINLTPAAETPTYNIYLLVHTHLFSVHCQCYVVMTKTVLHVTGYTHTQKISVFEFGIWKTNLPFCDDLSQIYNLLSTRFESTVMLKHLCTIPANDASNREGYFIL